MSDQPLTYASAGVDIDAAASSLRNLEAQIKASHGPEVVGGIGGFGGLFAPNFGGMERPILVSSVDGVGTKTKVAQMVGDYSNLGADIVNHCINDILCQGARPLFFLDYFGCSRLDATAFHQVVSSAAQACAAQGCALLGGETAEMPGVYEDEEIDVVGSIVGVVDQPRMLPRGIMQVGDKLIGLASSGLHTNGFSLARKALFDHAHMSVRDAMPHGTTTVGEELLKPHRCYARSVLPILDELPGIYALSHITGGGLYDNLPRVMPSDLQATIEKRTWTPLPIFTLIQEAGQISDREMFRTFNMGIGMVIIADKDVAPTVVQRMREAGEHAEIIGELHRGSHDVQIV